VPEALATVEAVMTSEFWREAMAGDERLVEVPFAVKSACDGETVIRYGVIDLAVRTPSGWRLIDYKTDQLSVEALAERYGEQARAYGRAWAELVEGPLAYTGLYGVRARRLSRNLTQHAARRSVAEGAEA
jgi:ATP-dependent exoDNAse (exonuclease V) beta subunit